MIPLYGDCLVRIVSLADLAQLGERQTEDLKVPGSIPGGGTDSFFLYNAKVRSC